jgi:hypothetical protein
VVNDFIRNSGLFDGVADFAAVTEDPANPSRLLPAYDTNTSVAGPGDHLHPNRARFLAMGHAINLAQLKRLVAMARGEVTRSRCFLEAKRSVGAEPCLWLPCPLVAAVTTSPPNDLALEAYKRPLEPKRLGRSVRRRSRRRPSQGVRCGQRAARDWYLEQPLLEVDPPLVVAALT